MPRCDDSGSCFKPRNYKNISCPAISDVDNMLEIMKSLGCCIERTGEYVLIDSSQMDVRDISPEYAASMRSSVFLMGRASRKIRRGQPSLSRRLCHREKAIDMHLAAFERMNIRVQVTGDRIFCSTDHMAGSGHRLRYPSVGATEILFCFSACAGSDSDQKRSQRAGSD